MSKKIELNIKTENGYEVLYPKTDSSNNIVNTEILNKFGLSEDGNVSDVLNELGKYNEYWWRRRVPNYNFYTKKQTILTSDNDAWTEDYKISTYLDKASIYISKEINIDYYTGLINLKNPEQLDSTGTKADIKSMGETIISKAPCYIYTINDSKGYFYIPDGATFSNSSSLATIFYGSTSSSNYWLGLYCAPTTQETQVIRPFEITAEQHIILAGDWEYISSTNSSEFPISGITPNYEYEYDYLGQPYENLKRGMQGELIKELEIRPTTYIATEILSGTELNTGNNYFFVVDYEINGKREVTEKYYTTIVLKVKRTTLIENYNGGTIASFNFQNTVLTASNSGRSCFSINYFPSENFKDISFWQYSGTSLHEMSSFTGIKWDSTTPVYITLAWDSSDNSSYGNNWTFEGSVIRVKIYKTTAF